MNKNNSMGTYKRVAGGWKHENGAIVRMRDAAGKFKRSIPGIVIVAMMCMIVTLGITNFINFKQIDSLEQKLNASQLYTVEVVSKGNRMVLDATLAQITQMEKDRAENDIDMFRMVDGSVDLTQTLKDQIITKRKSDALNAY